MDTTITNADENLDSSNEETAETVETEEEDTFEDEDESGSDDQQSQEDQEESEDEDEAQKRRERKQSTIDRLKKERDEWKAKAEAQTTKKADADDALLARLELRGVTEQEDQAEVLRYAKAEGKSPIEILNDDFMKSRLDHLKKQREQRQATQRPGNRTGVPSKSLDYYINRNETPKDPAMAEKVREELARRARESA